MNIHPLKVLALNAPVSCCNLIAQFEKRSYNEALSTQTLNKRDRKMERVVIDAVVNSCVVCGKTAADVGRSKLFHCPCELAPAYCSQVRRFWYDLFRLTFYTRSLTRVSPHPSSVDTTITHLRPRGTYPSS